MVTIKDVAREAHVAISTVSNVLNNVNNVSENTRQKVLDAVERLKYVPNSNARALKSGRKKVIGLFLPSVQGDFYRSLIQTIHVQCKLHGYILTISISNENTSEEIYGLIIAAGVSGAIIMNSNFENDYIERLKALDLPVVFLDRVVTGEKISSVTIDNYAGAAMAVEYLVKLGHKRIGYFHGLKSHSDEGDRYRAYLDVMKKYNLEVSEELEYEGMFAEDVAYSEIRKAFLEDRNWPDAFFCANDEMAWGCIRGLQDIGIKIPDQISVMGYDDNTLNAVFQPPLTTVHTNNIDLARDGVRELIRMIEAEDEAQGTNIALESKLITRATCTVRT